jgi:hypothetical protein
VVVFAAVRGVFGYGPRDPKFALVFAKLAAPVVLDVNV